jgi:hypothetical protein
MVEGKKYRDAESEGAGEQVTRRYLMGADGWNARQAGVLDDVPVTLIVGDYFTDSAGDQNVWPHDGVVAASSAAARELDLTVLPIRKVLTFPDVHSIFLSDLAELPFERALTWDPDALDAVSHAIATAEPPADSVGT